MSGIRYTPSDRKNISIITGMLYAKTNLTKRISDSKVVRYALRRTAKQIARHNPHRGMQK
jgi:hypothetical protein